MKSTAWMIVARREIVTKLTDRAFLLGTLGLIAILAGVLGVQAFMAEQGDGVCRRHEFQRGARDGRAGQDRRRGRRRQGRPSRSTTVGGRRRRHGSR